MLKTESHNVHTYYKQGCSEQLEQILLHCNNSSELLHLSFFSKDNQVNLRQTSQCLKAPAFPGACQECTDFPCSISIDNYSVQPLNLPKHPDAALSPHPPPWKDQANVWRSKSTCPFSVCAPALLGSPALANPASDPAQILPPCAHKARTEADTPSPSSAAPTEGAITTAIRCWSLAQSSAQ